MNTIVERLRAGPNSGDPLFEEAADEIELLRELRATDLELREADRAEIDRLRVDCDRLREFNTKLCDEIERLIRKYAK